jgi:hypothetical protein
MQWQYYRSRIVTLVNLTENLLKKSYRTLKFNTELFTSQACNSACMRAAKASKAASQPVSAIN